MVPQERRYRRLGIPLGLLQVLRDTSLFMPKDRDGDGRIDSEFDLFRTMEYAAGPLNFTFGRDDSGSSKALVNDVLNGHLNRDFNVYRGFKPATRLTAEGIGAPNWGKTILVSGQRTPDTAFQGVYIGAGPYVTVTTETFTDPKLSDLLGSSTPVYLPNTSMQVNHFTAFQAAAAITGGYRYFKPASAPTGSAERPGGLYLAANFNYLLGLHYDTVDLDIRFNTDAVGLVRTDGGADDPLALEFVQSKSGRGMAVDVGAIYTIHRWDVGVGVNGIGNRIKWTNVEKRSYVKQSLDGVDAPETTDAVPAPDVTVELPINTSVNVAYRGDDWLGAAEYSRRFNGNNFQGGVEFVVGRLAIRGGGRLARDRWHPATGVGINLTETFGVDVAFYGSSTNLERRRHLSLAVSLRFDRLRGGIAGVARAGRVNAPFMD